MTIALLVFLGFTAVVGSVPMIVHPEGSSMLPISLLANSPFRSFLIPGIVLLLANGALAFLALWSVVVRLRRYWLFTAFQGCVLLGWIVIECLFLGTVHWLHYLYATVGAVLLACGVILRQEEIQRTSIRAGTRREKQSV